MAIRIHDKFHWHGICVCSVVRFFQPHALNPNLGQADWLPFRMLLVAMLQTGSPIVLSGAEFNGCWPPHLQAPKLHRLTIQAPTPHASLGHRKICNRRMQWLS
jgi:hypothetical protein